MGAATLQENNSLIIKFMALLSIRVFQVHIVLATPFVCSLTLIVRNRNFVDPANSFGTLPNSCRCFCICLNSLGTSVSQGSSRSL